MCLVSVLSLSCLRPLYQLEGRRVLLHTYASVTVRENALVSPIKSCAALPQAKKRSNKSRGICVSQSIFTMGFGSGDECLLPSEYAAAALIFPSGTVHMSARKAVCPCGAKLLCSSWQSRPEAPHKMACAKRFREAARGPSETCQGEQMSFDSETSAFEVGGRVAGAARFSDCPAPCPRDCVCGRTSEDCDANLSHTHTRFALSHDQHGAQSKTHLRQEYHTPEIPPKADRPDMELEVSSNETKKKNTRH